MITYKVILTSKADKDEAGIYKYIADEFGEIYADNFRTKLIQLFKCSRNNFYWEDLQKIMNF